MSTNEEEPPKNEDMPRKEAGEPANSNEAEKLVRGNVVKEATEAMDMTEELEAKVSNIEDPKSQKEIIDTAHRLKEETQEACLSLDVAIEETKTSEEEVAPKNPLNVQENSQESEPKEENSEKDTAEEKENSVEEEFTEEEARQFVKSVEKIMAVFFGGEIPTAEAERSAEARELFEKYGAAKTKDDKDAVFAEILQEVANALNWDNLSEKQKEQVGAAMSETIAEKLAEEEKEKEEEQENNGESSKTEEQEKLDKEAFEKMTADAKARYIENLELGESYTQEDIRNMQEALEEELKINREKEESDLEYVQNELGNMAEAAADVLKEDNPEKFKEFLEDTKKKTDEKSKYLKCFYLQKIDSQNSGISREQYASLIFDIEKLDEVSKMLAEMIKDAAAGNLEIVDSNGDKKLSLEAKKKLGKFIKIFLAVAGVLGSIIILGKKVEEWAAANKMAGIAGKGAIATGTMTSALKLGMFLPVAGTAGKIVGFAAVLEFIINEKRRDDIMAWLTKCKVPFQSKKAASKPEGGK